MGDLSGGAAGTLLSEGQRGRHALSQVQSSDMKGCMLTGCMFVAYMLGGLFLFGCGSVRGVASAFLNVLAGSAILFKQFIFRFELNPNGAEFSWFSNESVSSGVWAPQALAFTAGSEAPLGAGESSSELPQPAGRCRWRKSAFITHCILMEFAWCLF